MQLKGSKTEQNLLKSFAGESQAYQRYMMFADKAKQEGYEFLSEVFVDNANMEKEHARRLFSFMVGGAVEITAAYPAGKVGTTKENLQASINGETEECDEAYPEFARVAKEEGFNAISILFTKLAAIEGQHAKRFKACLKFIEMEENKSLPADTKWICMRCGFVHVGPNRPGACPVCAQKNCFKPYEINLYEF